MLKIDKYSNAELRDCFAAAAQADALVCPEEYLRCYEFHTDWSDGVQMASFKSGGGDELIMIFIADSAIIKGFDHESPVSPHAQDPYGLYPGIYEGAPPYLLDALRDEALDFEDVTFCYWRTSDKGPWQKGPVDLRGLDDGSDYLLSRIVTSFNEYDDYAKDYFEDDYSPALADRVNALFERKKL